MSTTIADVLAFDAWPEEMKGIARRSVRDELEKEHEEAIEEAIEVSHEEEREVAQRRYEWVRATLAVVTKKLKEANACVSPNPEHEEVFDSIDASLTAAREIIEALPASLSDMTEPGT